MKASRPTPAYLILLLICLAAYGEEKRSAFARIELSAIEERARIATPTVSPDWRFACYTIIQANLDRNRYWIEHRITRLPPGEISPRPLATFDLDPSETYEASGLFGRSVSSFRWAPNSSEVAYISKQGGRYTVELFNPETETRLKILESRAPIKFSEIQVDDKALLLEATSDQVELPNAETQGPAKAGREVDDNRIFLGGHDPAGQPPQGSYKWIWGERRLLKCANTNTAIMPPVRQSEMSAASGYNALSKPSADRPGYSVAGTMPLGQSKKTGLVACLELLNPITDKATDAGREYVFQVRPDNGIAIFEESGGKDRFNYEVLGWGEHYLYYALRRVFTTTVKRLEFATRTSREVLTVDCDLSSGEHAVSRPELLASPNEKFLLVVKNSAEEPDALCLLDVSSKQLIEVDRPNKALGALEQVMEIQNLVLRNELSTAPIYGRLCMPRRKVATDQPMPIVVTSYVTRAGFPVSLPGEELPIVQLVQQGIGVLVVHTNTTNLTPTQGNAEFLFLSGEVPRRAILNAIEELHAKGLVDNRRVGIHGVSYGALIAMHCWRFPFQFRAASVASLSFEPTWYFFYQGLAMSNVYEKQFGLTNPDVTIEGPWKQMSPALNARKENPPILLQTGSDETIASFPGWLRLRKAGVQGLWFEYLNEGHLKFSPMNRYWINQRNLDWFLFWLKDEEDPDPKKSEQYMRWRKMKVDWEATTAASQKTEVK